MKTSNFTAVENIVKHIATINSQIDELSKCSSVAAHANNYQDGQIRLQVGATTPTGKHVIIAWIDILTDQKDGFINMLKEYNVEYDG